MNAAPRLQDYLRHMQIDLEVVWQTVRHALPDLLVWLPKVIADADQARLSGSRSS